MTMKDTRPKLAVGHVSLRARDVAAATRRLADVGVRKLLQKDSFAVLELRGGTHIVMRELESGTNVFHADFDFMVDDIDAARTEWEEAGFEVTAVTRGQIHDSFEAVAPEGFAIKVNSSHAGSRSV